MIKQSIARNMHKRRGARVQVEEVRKHAKTKGCCNGTGVPAGADRTRGEVCRCAQRRFFERYPGIIMDNDGNAWWPEDGSAEAAPAPRESGVLAAAIPVPGDEDAGKPQSRQGARRAEHAAKLRTKLDAVKAEELVAQELVAAARAEKVAEAEELNAQREDALAAVVAGEMQVTELDEKIREAEELVRELTRSKSEAVAGVDGARALAADLVHRVDAVLAEADEAARAERSRHHRLQRERQQLERRVHRIEARL